MCTVGTSCDLVLLYLIYMACINQLDARSHRRLVEQAEPLLGQTPRVLDELHHI